MSLLQLYETVMGDSVQLYDGRLTPAIDASQYYKYCECDGHSYYGFLMKLVYRLQPRKVLELGTSIGRSTSFMMATLPLTSSLTTVDIGSYQRVDLASYTNDGRLHIVYGNDLDVAVVDEVGDGYDLLFIDTEHSYEQLVAEWAIYQSRLFDNAIVVLDDIDLNEGMRLFWDELPYDKVDTGSGLHFSGFGLFEYRALRHLHVG